MRSILVVVSGLLITLSLTVVWADNFDALREQQKAVCESNCESTEGMMFLTQGGPLMGPDALQKCYSACTCVDQNIPHVFNESEFIRYVTNSSPDDALGQRYDNMVRTCVISVK